MKPENRYECMDPREVNGEATDCGECENCRLKAEKQKQESEAA